MASERKNRPRGASWRVDRLRGLTLGMLTGGERRVVRTSLGPASYVVAGTGPPVVLLHGLDGSARWWAPTMRGLREHFRCYALDFVRFDRWRERGRVPLSLAGAYVVAWLEALELPRTHLVAHSMGAYAAVTVAIESPQLVDRLALIAPAGLGPERVGLADAARLLGFLGAVAPALAPVLAVDTAITGPARFLRSAVELVRAEPPDLARIAAPTLFVWGLHDRLVPPSLGPLLRDRVPGARLAYLQGARHVPMYDCPTACNDLLARFLAGEEVGGA